ncbi:hypothetical protein MRB53_038247 [Persea americana]|nr:hypothetical protein MRB53_038247 [Persea americana]
MGAKLEANPDLYLWTSAEPRTAENFAHFYKTVVDPNPGFVLFAAFEKTRPEDPAGMIGLQGTSIIHLKAEVGPVFVFPEWQRTHVATNMIGLLLHWCLDSAEQDGLGLRRVTWEASQENEASIRIAKRMGFVYEGTLRWHGVLAASKVGTKDARNGGMALLEASQKTFAPGRHTVLLSVCWDDWILTRKQVDMQMARVDHDFLKSAKGAAIPCRAAYRREGVD